MSNKELSTEVATKLLKRIEDSTEAYGAPSQLAELAQAYSTVVNSMPKERGSARGGVV